VLKKSEVGRAVVPLVRGTPSPNQTGPVQDTRGRGGKGWEEVGENRGQWGC